MTKQTNTQTIMICINILLPCPVNLKKKWRNKITCTYMKSSNSKRQQQKVEVGVSKNPFDFISILLCETWSTQKHCCGHHPCHPHSISYRKLQNIRHSQNNSQFFFIKRNPVNSALLISVDTSFQTVSDEIRFCLIQYLQLKMKQRTGFYLHKWGLRCQ